jgi:hypothetical protein
MVVTVLRTPIPDGINPLPRDIWLGLIVSVARPPGVPRPVSVACCCHQQVALLGKETHSHQLAGRAPEFVHLSYVFVIAVLRGYGLRRITEFLTPSAGIGFSPRCVAAVSLPGESASASGAVGDNPVVGDVLTCEVVSVSLHGRVETRDGSRAKLYPGDRIACVVGNRGSLGQTSVLTTTCNSGSLPWDPWDRGCWLQVHSPVERKQRNCFVKRMSQPYPPNDWLISGPIKEIRSPALGRSAMAHSTCRETS